MSNIVEQSDIISASFYARPTFVVAKELLGALLVREVNGTIMAGIIVETEAYGAQDDPASHAYKGKRIANSAMFGPVGHSYVYFTYGNHFCLNVVAYQNAAAGAVLIRALEPVRGIEDMQKNRPVNNIISLTNGPGKLTQALAITREHNNIDVTQSGKLFIRRGKTVADENISITSRIGISKAQEVRWRFYVKGNQFVSRK